MRRTLVASAMLLALVWAAPAVLHAQTTAAVGGTVADATGALIPGVDVTATNVNTGISTVRFTNETGTYRIPSLQPGTYTLQAELPGFQTAIYEGVTLSAGSDVRYNFTLQVGTVATEIEVVAQSDQLLREQSASVGAVLAESEVADLPTFSRNVLDLAALIPGAVVQGTGSQNYGGMRQSQINTTRDGLPTGDGRYLDWNGAYSATFTSPDLVEEVQVNVTTADAAMGRGSGQVRMQTRSGTNQFHGALFYQNNNSALSSNDWFTNLVGGEKEYENRNQFGGRIGGPIVPNKAFFFVLYDGQRYVEKTEVVSTVLTPQARQGIFRYIAGSQNGNALSGTPSVDLNGNILDPGNLRSFNVFSDVNDPLRTSIDQAWIASQYLPRLPLPNDYTAGDGLNTAGYRWLRTQRGTDGATGATQTTNRDHLTVRIDYQINDDNKVSYSMTREENWGVTGQTGLRSYPDGWDGQVSREPDLYSAQWTSTISPTVLNEFRWGLKRDTWFGEPAHDIGCCGGDQYDQSALTDEAREVTATFPSLAGQLFYIDPGVLGLGEYAWMGVPTPRGSVSPLMQFADTASWSMGEHAFQSGFELTLSNSDQFNHAGAGFTRPNVTLGENGNVAIQGVSFQGLHNTDRNNAESLLAFLSGEVASVNQQYFINSTDVTRYNDYTDGILFFRDFHQNDWGAFVKDTWNLTSDLTLTMGFRYDVYGTPYDSNGMAMAPVGGQAGLFGISGTSHDALFQPGASGGSLTVFDFVGKNSPHSDLQVYKDDWNNFAPSLGFSWNVPWTDRATVVRGGYGISYTGAATFLQYSGSLGGAPGSALNISSTPINYRNITTSMALFPLDTGGAIPLEAVPLTNRTTGIQGYADNRSVPYVQSFNLSIQRELTNSTTLEVGYVGNKGTQLRSSQQLNAEVIVENGLLEAFNITRSGGTAPLFDAMLNGIRIGTGSSAITVGSNGTGSEALRRFNTTNTWLANGEVGDLAQWLTTTNHGTGINGGLITTNGFPQNFIVVNPQFGSVVLNANDDGSIYHSLQTSVTQRGRNLVGQFSYVWSRNLGNTGAGNGNSSDTDSGQRDPRNRALQRGLVGFHRTHNFKAHGTFDLPFGPGQMFLSSAPNWVSRIVEGWQISGIFDWVSGSPLTFTSGLDTLWARANDTNADLVGSSLADLDGKLTVSEGGVVQYFPQLSVVNAPLPSGVVPSLASRYTNRMVVDSSGNPVLVNPGPGGVGNTASNLGAIEGPASLGLDMGLSKRVQIDESRWFELRADVINILNTPQWNDPNTNINSTNFGRITGAGGNRTVTINARFEF